MSDKYSVDDILNELGEPTAPPAEPKPTKPVFKLDLDLDSEYGEAVETAPVVRAPTTPPPAPTPLPEDKPKQEKKPKKKRSWLHSLIYAVVVLGLSAGLAYFLIVGGLDFTGLTRPDKTVDITVPAGANTAVVAELLAENELIDQPLVFRVYARLTGADGTWQPGSFSLNPNMGYQTLVKKLQTARQRDTARVTFPEGFTVLQMAQRLEDKGVCTEEEFLRAATEIDYSADYDFIAATKTIDAADYTARVYKLEGYLFPDTYEFYLGCSGETVVRKMLDNFSDRLDTTIRASMSAKGFTLDELIILASIVQGEAGTAEDMANVSRVLANRMANTEVYPKLQCDSTGDYIEKMLGGNGTIEVKDTAYDTYEREGLPAGPINNPGLAAIKAVLTPSDNEAIAKCYFFATDYDTGKTYYSETYKQHEAVCKRYGIGMYG